MEMTKKRKIVSNNHLCFDENEKNRQKREKKYTHILVTLLFVTLFHLLFQHSILYSATTGSYWVERYNALSLQDHPFVPKTMTIFKRLLAAADKRENRYPSLVILGTDQELFALSLMDGTILLTQRAMEFCFENVDESTGASRMAFVLGHELAHLAMDDFWDHEAFDIIGRYGDNNATSDDMIKNIFRKSSDIEDSVQFIEARMKKEFQADAYGMLYASMAGYNPVSLVKENFFIEWKQQAGRLYQKSDLQKNDMKKAAGKDMDGATIKDMKAATIKDMKAATGKDMKGVAGKDMEGVAGKDMEDAKNRAEMLKARMLDIAADLDLFHLGVRLTQLGRYEDALEFLTEFLKKYPSREVLNNIGLIYYRMAMERVAACDPEIAYRFKLSTFLDSKTLAGKFHSINVRGKSCFENDIYQRYLQDSIRYFTASCEKDPYYIPSRVNLCSAFIMAEQFSAAVSAADEALKIKKDDPDILNNRAVALYLLGPSINVDMFEPSMKAFEKLIFSHPDKACSYYNLGVILVERKREEGVRKAWQKFLAIEKRGNFADIARMRIGKPLESSEVDSASSDVEHLRAKKTAHSKTKKQILFPSPVKLGDMDEVTMKQLQGFQRRIIDVGSIFGEYYTSREVKALAIEGVVELVERTMIHENITMSDFMLHYGKPEQIVDESLPVKICIYERFALEIIDNKIDKMIFYTRTAG
ncbi:hypothetical protein MTBBW1_2420005 [Desulfamplus magnetovallimortis]|uniref:Peptidase M48 domain-containing protein n=1 Tax=Desulfamplus magnetovallimortis TaxID=1246637 RepID=A0A1W1HE74_9BACT|nr:hypothetical protein [Desulfamplus magnetovallimortis]SLM30801.1 hypothetical protein MTBBW1_2420005 [Desulfamplus magnetovallimortis]